MFWEKGLKSGQPAYEFAASDAKRIRVIAGPGAGKSFSMRRRVLRLLEEGVDPKKILVLTFTNITAEALKKDIREIADELKKEAEESSDGSVVATANELIDKTKKIEATTLHKLCQRIVPNSVHPRNWWKIQDYELELLKRDLSVIQEHRAEGDCVLPSDLHSWLRIYKRTYIGDLISEAVKYLKERREESPDLWTYQHVLVDEYQDLNAEGQELVSLLTAKDGNLTVIGDDDQSIYSFLGANPQGLDQFKENHSGVVDFKLEDCYRCPKFILRKAHNLIKKNKSREDKTLKPLSDMTQGSMEVHQWATAEDEAKGISEIIRDERKNNKGKLTDKDIIVLVPESSEAERIRTELDAALAATKPRTVSCFRGAAFDPPAVQESFSWLSLLADETDLISWRYLLEREAGASLSRSFYYILKHAASEEKGIGKGLFAAHEQCRKGENPTGKGSVKQYITKHYADLDKKLQDKKAALEAARNSKDETLKILCSPLDPDALKPSEKDYYDLLAQAIDKNDDPLLQWEKWLRSIRRHIAYQVFNPGEERTKGKIRVMSLHAAKGLSAGLVVVMSASEGLIPKKGKSKQEQRRLFYVAITRCKGWRFSKAKDEGHPIAKKNWKDGNALKYPGKVIVSFYTTAKDGTPLKPSRYINQMSKKNIGFQKHDGNPQNL